MRFFITERKGIYRFGLDSKSEFPFMALLKKEIFGVKDISEIDNEDIDNLIYVTRDIIEKIKTDTKIKRKEFSQRLLELYIYGRAKI